MSTFRLAALSLMLAQAATCASNPATPAQNGPLRLTAQTDRADVAPGVVATATFRLENVGASAITLDFSSGCQLMPFIEKRAPKQIVHPEGGSWMCTMAMTQLTLGPGESKTIDVRVTSGEGTRPIVGLPPGEYALFARIESLQHTLESPRVNLTVR